MYYISEYFNLFLCSMLLSYCCYSRWLLIGLNKKIPPIILIPKCGLAVSFSLRLLNCYRNFYLSARHRLHGLRYHSCALSNFFFIFKKIYSHMFVCFLCRAGYLRWTDVLKELFIPKWRWVNDKIIFMSFQFLAFFCGTQKEMTKECASKYLILCST